MDKNEKERIELNKKLIKSTFFSELKKQNNARKILLQCMFILLQMIVAEIINTFLFDGSHLSAIIILGIVFGLTQPIFNVIYSRVNSKMDE